MAKTKKVERKLRKFPLDVILSVYTGYMIADSKDPQGSYIDLIEHITKEKYNNASMLILEKISLLFLKAKFPETKLTDLNSLAKFISEGEKRTQLKLWLDECVDKGMQRSYRVKGLTSKEYNEVFKALFSEK